MPRKVGLLATLLQSAAALAPAPCLLPDASLSLVSGIRLSHRQASAKSLAAATATLVSGWVPNLSVLSAHASSGATAHASGAFPAVLLCVFLSTAAVSLALSTRPSADGSSSGGSGGGGGGSARRGGNGGGSAGGSSFDRTLFGTDGGLPLGFNRLAPFADGELQYIPAGAGFYTDDEVEAQPSIPTPLPAPAMIRPPRVTFPRALVSI
jgi:hypothetical protein